MSVAREVARAKTREATTQKERADARASLQKERADARASLQKERADARASLEIGELRPAEEVIPRLGAKPGMPAARVGPVSAYDKPLQEVCGNLATASLRLPLRLAERKHLVIVAWVLEPVDPFALMRALVRSSHPDGTIWLVTYKKEFEKHRPPSYEELLRAGLGAGWVDSKILPIGNMLQATRFVERRPGARSVSGGVRGRHA